jgi:hypothetical protein
MAGSLGAAGGARTNFDTGIMRTRVSAGDQATALGGDSFGDPYAFIKKLRADKEAQRRAAAEWDADQARREEWKDTALSAAPPDAHGEAMRAARTQADIADLLQGRKEAAVERTRQRMLARTDADPSSMVTKGMGSYRSFGHLMPAAAMHGIDIMAGNPTGWDQYAALNRRA